MNNIQGRFDGQLSAGLNYGKVLAASLLFTVFPENSIAGRDPEEWDDLPQIDSFSFTKTSVGFSAYGGKHYVLDRLASEIREVTKEQFSVAFGASTKAAKVMKDTGIGSTVALQASTGIVLTTQNAYCSEGEDRKHTLSMNGAPLIDHVAPCHSISAAEIVGNQLWLGTRADGEYGDYPGEGIVVQSMDKGRLLKALGTKQGLTGDLVRAIRFDPFDKTVWISTNQGINEVDQGFRILKSLFFFQELDPTTGAKFSLSPAKRKGDLLASIFMRLQVTDPKKFYEAARTIPAAIQEGGLNEIRYNPNGPSSLEQAFVPKEMNALVPFFIESARSTDQNVRWHARQKMCAFNDQRIIEFLIEQSKQTVTPQQSSDSRSIRWCLEKFTNLGLINAQQK